MARLNLTKILAGLALTIILVSPVFAGLEEDLAANKTEQERLQKLINEAQGQANTLFSQISRLNNQIRLTQLQIDAKQADLNTKEAELASLNADIGTLTARIANLEESLSGLAKIAVRRFRAGQAVEGAAPFETILLAGDFQTFSSNLAYLEYVKNKDQSLFAEMRSLKSGLSVQKATLQERQAEVSKLRDEVKAARDELASARSQLDSQKGAKVQLLKITQNDEARYQRLLEAARKEAEQIALAYQNKGGSRYVRKGEIIGTEGYSGYVYPKNIDGTHLHFGFYNQPYNYYQSMDPCAVLACNRQGYVGTVSSGAYRVPINYDGTNYAYVSQWWGRTQYYWLYNGGIHTGIDMYTYFGDIVRAAEEGQAYFYRGGYDNGNGVFIYHPDGHVTLYWHLN